MKILKSAVVVILAVVLMSNPASAAIRNGSFERGTNGWSVKTVAASPSPNYAIVLNSKSSGSSPDGRRFGEYQVRRFVQGGPYLSNGLDAYTGTNTYSFYYKSNVPVVLLKLFYDSARQPAGLDYFDGTTVLPAVSTWTQVTVPVVSGGSGIGFYEVGFFVNTAGTLKLDAVQAS